MANDLFSRFNGTVCGEILFRPARKKVAAELTAHLEDAAQAMTERGLPEEEAQARAVAAMGDPKALGKALHRQHWPVLGWIGLLWPAVVIPLVFLHCLVLPHLPDNLYLQLAGVDLDKVVYSSSLDDRSFQQYGVHVTREGNTYHFYRTGTHPVLGRSLFMGNTWASITCHVTYNTDLEEVTYYVESPGSCLTQYPEDFSAEYVHLRYAWTDNSRGDLRMGVFHVGLLPADQVEEAWAGDCYRETGGGLVLFAGFEEDGALRYSYSENEPIYDLRFER